MAPFKIPSPTELTKFWINGEYVQPSTDEVFTVYNPKDNSIVSDKVPVGAAADIDLAVKHAEAAFKGEWSTFTSAQRARCLNVLADIMDENLDGLLRLDTLTGGHPVSLIPTREKNYIVNGLRYMGAYKTLLLLDGERATDMPQPAGVTSSKVNTCRTTMALSSS